MRPTGGESGHVWHARTSGSVRLAYGGVMRIVLVTSGGEDRARPLVALAGGLSDAGHDVTLLANDAIASMALAAGIRFEPLGGDEASSKTARVLAWHNRIDEFAPDADVFVGASESAWVAVSVADSRHKPALIAATHPVAPSRELPHPFSPRFDLPGPLVRHTGRLAAGAQWRAARDPLMTVRARLGLPTFPRPWEDITFLLGYSPTLVPRPNDWDDLQVVTGDWQLIRADAGEPDGLSDFLNAGEPPVYVGFGTHPLFERPRVRTALLGGLAGRRILAVGPGAELLKAESPGVVFAASHVEHDLVFPRCSLVVHHAGSGTTHSAVRWAVPSVTVPLERDQPFWAWRIEELGAGAAPLARNRLSPTAVADAVEHASDSNVAHRLDRLADVLRREQGIPQAVAALEFVVSSR